MTEFNFEGDLFLSFMTIHVTNMSNYSEPFEGFFAVNLNRRLETLKFSK